MQVLDDSTDDDTRALVDRVCAEVRASTGRRLPGAAARRSPRLQGRARWRPVAAQTDAEFIVIFDADFLPPADYLQRTIPHFYGADGQP